MNENIRGIFEKNIDLLGKIERAVYYFREQQYNKALDLVANSIDKVKTVIEAVITDSEYFNLLSCEALLKMLQGIIEAKKNKDFILLADLLELQLVSFLTGVQELIISKEEILFNEENYQENIRLLLEKGTDFPSGLSEPVDTAGLLEDGYRIEFTSCGLMTLAAENEGSRFYFHTNSNIRTEAFLLAKSWYRKDKKRYILYGFGMGYHVTELQALADKAEIEVYEADQNVMQLACAFSDIKELLQKEQVKLIYDSQLSKLKTRLSGLTEEEVFIIHYPSYKNIRSEGGKETFRSAFPWLETMDEC